MQAPRRGDGGIADEPRQRGSALGSNAETQRGRGGRGGVWCVVTALAPRALEGGRSGLEGRGGRRGGAKRWQAFTLCIFSQRPLRPPPRLCVEIRTRIAHHPNPQ